MTVEPHEDEEVAPLVRPPDLNRESNRTATVLELFFDLAFVIAIAQVATRVLDDPSWGQVAVCGALVTLIWWAWASTTLYANRFDTDDLVYRVLKLAGMLAVVVVAASVGGVGGAEGRWFAVGYGALHLLLAAQYLRAWRSVPAARTTIVPYLLGHGVGGLVFLVSAAVPAPVRWALWAIGLAIQLAAPLMASKGGESPLHLEHLPERFGLFIILVLGESIASAVEGLEHQHFAGGAFGSTVLTFAVAAGLWWVYFDQIAATAKRGLSEAGDVSKTEVHDVYLFAHLPIVLALVAVAIGLEQLIDTDVLDAAPASARWLVAGGSAAFLVSSGVLQGVLLERRTAAFPAVAGALAMATVVLPGRGLLLGAVAVILVAVVATGRHEEKQGRLPADH